MRLICLGVESGTMIVDAKRLIAVMENRKPSNYACTIIIEQIGPIFVTNSLDDIQKKWMAADAVYDK